MALALLGSGSATVGQAVNVRSQAVTSMYVVLESVCVSRVVLFLENRFDHSYFLLLFLGVVVKSYQAARIKSEQDVG